MHAVCTTDANAYILQYAQEVHPKPSWNQVIIQLVLNQLRVQPEPEWASPWTTWGSAFIIWIVTRDQTSKCSSAGRHSSVTGAGRTAGATMVQCTHGEGNLFIKHGLGEVIKHKTLFKATGWRLCCQHFADIQGQVKGCVTNTYHVIYVLYVLQ